MILKPISVRSNIVGEYRVYETDKGNTLAQFVPSALFRTLLDYKPIELLGLSILDMHDVIDQHKRIALSDLARCGREELIQAFTLEIEDHA